MIYMVTDPKGEKKGFTNRRKAWKYFRKLEEKRQPFEVITFEDLGDSK